MAIRLVTKTGGRLSARVHSAFFHLAKGNSLKEKPYGIVPTKDYEDPFGLVFDNTELKVRINPGQFSCYGRQCIITEETEVLRMGDVYLTSDKLYMTVYARIDLNDQVFQNVELRYAYNTEAHVDFPKHQMAQNLYRKTNGLYDVPLARFVFHQNPTTPDGYFTDYEKVIETFDDESRAVTKQTERIGSKSEARLLDNGAFILKADHANHSKGASLIGNTEISGYLDDVWTAKRASLFLHSATNFNKENKNNISLPIDKNHLQYAFLTSEHHHYAETTGKHLQVCLRFRVDHPTAAKVAYLFIPLRFNIKMEMNVPYWCFIDESQLFLWNSQKTREEVANLTISKSLTNSAFTFFAVTLTDDGIKWNGYFSRGESVYESPGVWGFAESIEIVTAEITKGKVSNWFYGNQGKSVYVDFIYKGGVTLV